jgi:murein DD-endopeptidase MepM/ murein hydrolase activator NlpD
VFIQHGERYQTKYLHFTRRAVKVGDWVKQGDVIGYLGSTGMVTGAHLHYEFLVDGVHRNPRTVELPKAEPIDKKEKAKFLMIANQQMSLLDNNKRIMLAMN